MPPEAAQQALERIGYKGLTVGPDATAQQRQEELKRRQAISQSFGQLTPEERADPLRIGQVFLQNGDHATGAKYIEMADRRVQQKETLLATLAQRAEEMEKRSEDRTLTREMQERLATQANDLRAQLAQGQQAIQRESLEIRRLVASQGAAGPKAPKGYRYKQDGTLEPIPGGPATKDGSKMPAELQRMTIGLNSLETGLVAYENLLKDFNPRSTDQLNMRKRAQIDSLVADLRMQSKEAQALGALTGPDVAILDKALAEPTSVKGALYGRGGLTEQIAETRAAIQRRREGISSLGKPKEGGGPPKKISTDAEYNALPSGAEYVAPDGSVRRKK